MRKTTVMQNISFREELEDLHKYVNTLATDKFGGNFSLAMMDCIQAHQAMSVVYGDWRNIRQVPVWIKRVIKEVVENVLAEENQQESEEQLKVKEFEKAQQKYGY